MLQELFGILSAGSSGSKFLNGSFNASMSYYGDELQGAELEEEMSESKRFFDVTVGT